MRNSVFGLLLLLLLQSCLYGYHDDVLYQSNYEPITQSRAEFEKSVQLLGPREVGNAGKIYIKDDLIFLNEVGEGFHIIDNSDPQHPEPLAFVRIPFATDLAIRNQTVYAHHGVDLVAFSYSVAGNELDLRHRERNVFPALPSPDGFEARNFTIPEGHVVIGYKQKN